MIYLKFIGNYIKLEKKIIFLILIITLLFSFLSSALTKKDLTSKQLLCPSLLWGFEFISHNRVKVIDTDLNKKTKITEYYYDTDLDLSYINIFFDENNIRDRVYSIELNTLRVDIWTMTGGGFTTREMFPIGLCEFVKTNNIYSLIESLKQNS
tara:strand:+ start:103 stop:561 length:459 start_codon:yes stop_codon:yes gene_type:complete